MSEAPFRLELAEVEHHENGDATYKFDMDEDAAKYVAQEGLKLMLYCGVSKVDLQDVYDWVLKQGDKNE